MMEVMLREKGVTYLLVLTVVIFLLTGGLTVISFNSNATPVYFDRIADYIASCENNMNIVNFDNTYLNLNTRCENWALYVAFCTYLLFLVQPNAMIAIFFKKGTEEVHVHHGDNKEVDVDHE